MSCISMAANKYPDKNILGNWELFTYDINMYNFGKKKDKKVPYVSYSNIGFKNYNKGSSGHFSNNEVEKNSQNPLENTVRQNGEKLTKGRTKQ